jgi:hypothetical protein
MIRRSFFKALSTLAALPVVGKLIVKPATYDWSCCPQERWMRATIEKGGTYTLPAEPTGMTFSFTGPPDELDKLVFVGTKKYFREDRDGWIVFRTKPEYVKPYPSHEEQMERMRLAWANMQSDHCKDV